MPRRSPTTAWRKAWQRGAKAVTKQVLGAARSASADLAAAGRPDLPKGSGTWTSGVATGAGGLLKFRLFRPADVPVGERLPVLVMLHGCAQDAAGFARSTRMDRVAARERFLVLLPEQSRLANPQGCWNWFETESGRAQAEADLVLAAIDQVALLHGGDRARVAVAGLSAGAGLAALLAWRHPDRLRAVAMHSGVGPGVASSTATALRAMRGKLTADAKTPMQAPSQDLPPLLVIQGRRDAVVAPVNAQAVAERWAAMTGANVLRSRDVLRGRRHPMAVTDYRRGARTMVTKVEIDDLGHAWSGGAASEPFSDADGPDASRMIWRFVARQLTTDPVD